MKTMLALVIAMLVTSILLSYAAWAQETESAKAERIAISELKKKLDSGEKFLLIDVREDWELEENGAIEGAIHIPVAELEGRMKDIPKDVQVVFY